jgi:hypothetical protein
MVGFYIGLGLYVAAVFFVRKEMAAKENKNVPTYHVGSF